MVERELAKLDGQRCLLEQQKIQLEGSIGDVSVMGALKEGAAVIGERVHL